MSNNSKEKSSFKSLYSTKSIFYLLLGVLIAVFALKGFMIPNGFLDGGITGVSLLLHEVFHFDLSILLLLFNIILLFLFPYLKKVSNIRSFIAVGLLAAGLYFIPIMTVTSDKLLIAIFGGVCLGTGAGLVIRSGAAIDGIELLVHRIIEKTGFSATEVTLFFNAIIFFTAAAKFGIESAMYSLITYFAALKTTDYIVFGINEMICVNIISKKPEEVKTMLVDFYKKAITVYKGERGYLPNDTDVNKIKCDIVVAVVTRFELTEIHEIVNTFDKDAFVYITKIKGIKGGVLA